MRQPAKICVPKILPLVENDGIRPRNHIDSDTPIEITCATPDVNIFYTTNGTNPAPFAPVGAQHQTNLYDRPFYLQQGDINCGKGGAVVVKAVAVSRDGQHDSKIVTRTFYLHENNDNESLLYGGAADRMSVLNDDTNGGFRSRSRDAWSNYSHMRRAVSALSLNNQFKSRNSSGSRPGSAVSGHKFRRRTNFSESQRQMTKFSPPQICPECCSQYRAGQKFCPQCGLNIKKATMQIVQTCDQNQISQEIEPKSRLCMFCRSSNSVDATFCGACGRKCSKKNDPNLKPLCPQCHVPISNGHFCTNCGALLTSDLSKAVAEARRIGCLKDTQEWPTNVMIFPDLNSMVCSCVGHTDHTLPERGALHANVPTSELHCGYYQHNLETGKDVTSAGQVATTTDMLLSWQNRQQQKYSGSQRTRGQAMCEWLSQPRTLMFFLCETLIMAAITILAVTYVVSVVSKANAKSNTQATDEGTTLVVGDRKVQIVKGTPIEDVLRANMPFSGQTQGVNNKPTAVVGPGIERNRNADFTPFSGEQQTFKHEHAWKIQVAHVANELMEYVGDKRDFGDRLSAQNIGKLQDAFMDVYANEGIVTLTLDFQLNQNQPANNLSSSRSTGQPLPRNATGRHQTAAQKVAEQGKLIRDNRIESELKKRSLDVKNQQNYNRIKNVNNEIRSKPKNYDREKEQNLTEELFKEIQMPEQDVETVQKLISQGANVNAVHQHQNGQTPMLILAIQNSFSDAVQVLLEAGADANKQFGINKASALHEAVKLGGADGQQMVNILLEHDASPFFKNRQDETALDLARKLGKGREKMIDSLAAKSGQMLLQ